MTKPVATGSESTSSPAGWSVYALIVNAIVGVGISGYLTYVHLQVKYAAEIVGGLCNLSATVNCNTAAASEYSAVGGIPIAVLGGAFYLAVIVGTILWKVKPDASTWTPRLFVFLFAGSVVYSLFLGAISGFVLRSICWACLLLYVVNIAGLVFSRALAGEGYVASLKAVVGEPTAMVKTMSTTVITLAFLGSTIAASLFVAQVGADMKAEAMKKVAKDADDIIANYGKLPVLNPALWKALQETPAKGAEGDVPVVIIEFSDFECPFCARVVPTLDRLIEEHPDEVRLHFVNFPLHQDCNPHAIRSMHPQACLAAKAALCAEPSGKFWPVHDALFASYDSLDPPTIVGLGEKQGIGAGEFQACVESKEIATRLAKDMTLGKRAAVRGTPAIYINGRKVGGARPYEFFKKIVEFEIESRAAK